MSARTDFWSRRKAAVATEANAPTAQTADTGSSDAEILRELNLPDPDTLGPGDDFAAFMQAALPDHIRRKALRRLWGTNPVLANLDNLVDYGDDFTDAATVVENMQTVYQVGKGMVTQVMDTLETITDETDPPEPEADPPAQLVEATLPPPTDDTPPPPASRRRMRFEFPQDSTA